MLWSRPTHNNNTQVTPLSQPAMSSTTPPVSAPFQVSTTGLLDVLLLTPTASLPANPSQAELQTAFGLATGKLVQLVEQRQLPLQANQLVGLRYQLPPHVHGSLVQATQGRVFVAVADIRKFSPAFGQWTSVELSPSQPQYLWLPPGLAVGYLGLAAGSNVCLHHTGAHSAKHERAIVWNDPDLCINWPTTGKPQLTAADQRGQFFSWWSMPKDSTFGGAGADGHSQFGA